MRLWTLHPCFLDAQGLVALWRESLLAQKVLRGATKGYRHHPQLLRFRVSPDPLGAIATYLRGIFEEAESRGYRFDAEKIIAFRSSGMIEATEGQLRYEWLHLRQKLQHRGPDRYETYCSIKAPSPHPLFRIVPGDVQPWERGAARG